LAGAAIFSVEMREQLTTQDMDTARRIDSDAETGAVSLNDEDFNVATYQKTLAGAAADD